MLQKVHGSFSVYHFFIRAFDNKEKVDKSGLFDYHRTMKELNLAVIFKALSCEQRLYLFKSLYEWSREGNGDENGFTCDGIDKCFTKACCCMNLSRSTISHHFKELQNAGLISYTRNGQSFTCKINMEAVDLIWNFLK